MMHATSVARPELDALPQGWFNHGQEVLRLLDVHRPRVVVELGTWLGASAIAMARSVRRWGGTVTCVDTWAGDLDEQGRSPVDQTPMMILSCARTMVEAGINASVRLIPASTQAAAERWHGPIDFLYIDADHSHDGVLADLRAWVPHVRPGGVIAGDDYGHPHFPGVATAWSLFEHERGLTCTRYQSTPPCVGGIQLISAVIHERTYRRG